MQAKPIHAHPAQGARESAAPMCYFCSSTESMEAQGRRPNVFILSALVPRLRWRYCRYCHRHFLTLRRSRHA